MLRKAVVVQHRVEQVVLDGLAGVHPGYGQHMEQVHRLGGANGPHKKASTEGTKTECR